MKRRILPAMTGAAILVLGGARTASAQAQPDPGGLAGAVAAVLADSVMPRLGGCDPVYVQTPATAFDSATAVILEAAPGAEAFGTRRPPAYEWLGTRGFTMQGDTAAVMVEVGTTSRTEGPVDTYVEHNLYFFVRDPSGWRFVRRRFVRGLDLGPVRG